MNEDIQVLIVEDDPMVSHLNRMYTEKVAGFEVLAEINIDNNLELNDNYFQKANLLLLDIYLPRQDGLEILEEIREKEMDIDVIIISAAKDVEHINKAMHWGVVDYLIKPFTFERFKKSLLKYKDIVSSFNGKQDLRQQEIDSLMGSKDILNNTDLNSESANNNTSSYIRELPKGLNKETLGKIKNYLRRVSKEVTTRKIANKVGLSRVTAQRYLKYMAGEGIVNVEKKYGSVGRPKHYYKFMK